MPVVDCSAYKPTFLFRNPHFATIYPAFFRKQEKVNFTRQRINTEDGDFLDIDLLMANGNEHAIFLFHGLEGSTDSQYIQAAAKQLHAIGYDIIATNFRGCSGEPNLKANTYHSGFTDDLVYVLDKFSDQYKTSSIVAYSLGGNVTLKYAGESPTKVHPRLKKIIAVSVPVHLSDGAVQLQKASNYVYTQNFLKTLRKKIKEKHKNFPNQVDIEKLPLVKSIKDFDDYFTGPMNGFKDAEDYYAQSMSLQFIPDIKIETHIISSLDDPFLPKSCFPFAEAKNSKNIYLHPSNYGGHVGFYQKGNEYWIDSKLLDILGQFPS